jgi:serine/threonine protein kinase
MCQNLEDGNKGLVSPFRQYLPVRYYICDFELAVTFDLDSDPASRVFTGFPGAGLRTGEYNREVAPEMRSGKPYCPFRADIFQLGYMFKTYFGVRAIYQCRRGILTNQTPQHLGQFSQPLVDLFSNMCSDSPASRPSASVALERVRRIRAGLSNDVLSSSVPRYPLPPWYNSMLQVRCTVSHLHNVTNFLHFAQPIPKAEV